MNFLTEELARSIAKDFGTPVYVYSEKELMENARKVLAFPHAFGFLGRYAMKALPNGAVLQILHNAGLHIDASSGYEVERAMLAGIPGSHIQLTSQQLPADLFRLVIQNGVLFNACSLHQIETYGRLINGASIGKEISIRVNPGLGSGHCKSCNTGGPGSSFGIWHRQLAEAKQLAAKYGLTIKRLHTHIGSGSDPDVWVKVANMSLAIAEQLPDVEVLNLGGGFKVGRVPGEKTTDLQVCGNAVKKAFERFAEKTGRELKLEVEPGTYVAASAGVLLTTVTDVVTTKPDSEGMVFVKADTGMTEITRPALYGAQHPITVVPHEEDPPREIIACVVSGHCCESGDILTPAPGDPGTIATRDLPSPKVGDILVIGYTGAYCSGMSTKNYNSFPEAPEVLIHKDGTLQLIRRRQTLAQMVQNETGL